MKTLQVTINPELQVVVDREELEAMMVSAEVVKKETLYLKSLADLYDRSQRRIDTLAINRMLQPAKALVEDLRRLGILSKEDRQRRDKLAAAKAQVKELEEEIALLEGK